MNTGRHQRGSGFRRALMPLAACVLLAAAHASGHGGAGAARPAQQEKMLDWVKRHHPRLYDPRHLKIDLARLLPEPNAPPAERPAPLKAGDRLAFRLLVTNASDEVVLLPVAGTYKHNRPRLTRGGAEVPYRRAASELARASDVNYEYRTGRHVRLDPDQTATEIIDLGDWYDPLAPGAYKLVVRHRFIWGGGWLESPPVTFTVVP